MRDNQLSFRLSGTILALLASVSVGAVSMKAQASDVVEEFEMSASQKTYLEESPYANRREGKDLPTTRRRTPMRFSKDTDASPLPSFGSYRGEKVKRHLPDPVASPALPLALDEEMVTVPSLGEVVELPSTIETPPVREEAVVSELSIRKMEDKRGPQSILDSVFSAFGESEREVNASDVVRPAKLSKVKSLPKALPASQTEALRPVPARPGLKSVVIPAKRGGSAQLHRTRDIVEPPEMKNLKPESPISSHISPLIEMKQRFAEVLPEIPASESAKPVLAKLPKELPALPSKVESASAAPAQPMIQVPTKPVETTEVAVEVAKDRGFGSKIRSLVAEAVGSKSVDVADTKAVLATEKEEVSGAPEIVMPVIPKETAMITSSEKVVSAEKVVPQEELASVSEPVIAPAAPQKAEKVKPMRREVIMQPLHGEKSLRQHVQAEPDKASASVKKEFVEVPEVPVSTMEANVVVEEAEAIELSKASKNLLKKFPSNLNKPKASAKKDVEISRITVPDLELTQPEIKEHEALGISIKVQKPDLNVNDYLVMAYEAIEQNNIALAAQYYQAILEVKPAHEDAMLGLATVSHRLGDIDVARDLYQRLLARAPRDTSVLNNFLVLISEESPEKAVTELLALEKKNPYYDVLPAQIAAIYANQNELDKAIEKIGRAVELSPENLMYRYNMAVMLDHAGYKKQAIQAYRQVKQATDAGQNFTLGTEHLQERLTFLLSNVS